jgi:hypothetical protein
MLKGVGNHSYDDVLEVPIIDNRPTEDLLADQMEEALLSYPKCNAVSYSYGGTACTYGGIAGNRPRRNANRSITYSRAR